MKVEVEDVKIEDTVAISLDSAEENEGIISFVPVELVFGDKKTIDNRAYLLKAINEKYNNNGMLNILSSGYVLDNMCQQPGCGKNMQRLSESGRKPFDKNYAYAWFGNYLDYISKIYNADCRKLIDKKPEVKFSIVIPARNSSRTLKHTLKTCLNQRYSHDYEIVVSDNSTGYNAEVFELCKELNDSRIIYLKTPRDLHLPKSFEYACLNARGEYIIPLGSDDGLLPWALETLEKITLENKAEEVIQWERGFYAWPGFNGGQQNQFLIPREYKKSEYNVFYREKVDYIAAVLNNPKEMYSLPMLYINSCFKRTYLSTLLQRTGRLWDGICQDIYMGVVCSCINDKILNIRYPLSIAGMSSGSVGAKANNGQNTNNEFVRIMRELKKDGNVGGYCKGFTETLISDTGTDTCSLYHSLLRAVSMEILPKSYLSELFDWKKIYIKLASEMDMRDVAFDRKLHEMQYAASKHGEDFLKWFNESIYDRLMEPKLINEERITTLIKEKTYKESKNELGGWALDASEYGVSDICGAVQLFAQKTGL